MYTIPSHIFLNIGAKSTKLSSFPKQHRIFSKVRSYKGHRTSSSSSLPLPNRCQASVKTRQKQICEIQMQENLIANSMCLSRFSSTIVRIFLSKQVCYGSSSALETYLPWCCCKQDWRGESSQNLSSSRDRPNWLPLEGRWLGSQIQG